MNISPYSHANLILTNSSGNSLWLGDAAAAENLEWLKHKNITTVFTVAAGLDICYDGSIRHYQYDLLDNKEQKISVLFQEVSKKIHYSLKFGSILVHCGAGVSRSASFVIAYLIRFHKMAFHQALNFSKKKRKEVCPNLNFQMQLKKYDLAVHEQLNQSKYQLPTIIKIDKSHTKATRYPNIGKSLTRHREKKSIKAGQVSLVRQHPLTISEPGLSPSPLKNSSYYIRKLAQFRFGSTNLGRWGLS